MVWNAEESLHHHPGMQGKVASVAVAKARLPNPSGRGNGWSGSRWLRSGVWKGLGDGIKKGIKKGIEQYMRLAVGDSIKKLRKIQNKK